MRFIQRNEFFGSLLYDTVGKDYFCFDHLASALLRAPSRTFTPSELEEAYDADLEDVEEVRRDLVELGTAGNTEFRGNRPIPGMLSAPLRVFYEITYRCPESCKHCYTESDQRDPDELTLDEKLAMLEQMCEMGCYRISIAGGEPLVDRDFFPFVERALEKRIDVSFSTNGTLITTKIAKRLASLDIRTINVSLDGWDDESFGIVRGRGRLEYVVRGLKTLRRHYPYKIAAKCTLMKTNIHNLDQIIKLSEELELDVVKFNCVREAGRAIGENWLAPSQEEYIESMRYLAGLYNAKQHKIKMVLPVNPFQHLDDEKLDVVDELGFGCYAGKESFCVTPTGDITPCSSFGRGNFTDGNVRERTLLNAWLHGDSMKLFRGLDGSDDCRGCGSYKGCRGGCYLRSFRETGQLNATDPYCYERKNSPSSGASSLPVISNPRATCDAGGCNACPQESAARHT